MKAAMNYLKIRPRSRGELEDYLERKSFSSEARASVLIKLEENGLIDDRNFVEAWLYHRTKAMPRGRLFVIQELRRKKVPQDLIDSLVGPYFSQVEEEMAMNLAQRKWEALAHSPRGKQKLAFYLKNKGFPTSVISRILERLLRL